MRIGTLAKAAVLALTAVSAQAQNADLGQEVFSQYCATCHGATGAGDGPMAALMTTSIPDLRQLAARNDGEFPMLRVIHIIDGRTELRAHGGPMPVYGTLFSAGAGTQDLYVDVLYTRGRVLSLAYYLETIQN
ncbi:MAG: cytochrome c [Paracoccaceae bacterium]|nr:cytochrome c [Paracoccaceae bacterium]